MIDIQNITFRYSSKSAPVFDNFCLRLEQNKVIGLLGENGTGKSTLLYLLMGLLRPNEGHIKVENTDVSHRTRATLQQMYIVPEEFALPQMRFADYVAAYRPFYPVFSDDILRRCMEEFHLPLDVRVDQLSMGDKKKVLMSFALATNVRYLLMDEPTNGLDVPSKKQFRKVIATTMTEERTLIIATHQLHDVESLLDHVLILQRSQLLLNESVEALCEKYTFDVRSNEALTDDVLYTERTPQGNATLSLRQPDDEETQLNLELLFNAVTSDSINGEFL
jgi:ABC-2 type transport system ATP-binding protein